MALSAYVILNRATTTLLDPAGFGWPQYELLDYLNAAQRAVCLVRPDAYTRVSTVDLVAGVIQSIPADDGNMLLRVLYNANGQSVRHAGIDAMSAAANWASGTPASVVREWTADSRDRMRFLVNPPNDGTGSVVVHYAAYPPPIASVTENISLPDVYETPLWAYVMFMAYSKNSRRQDITKAQAMLSMFMALTTGAQVAAQAVFPDLRKIEQGQA